MQTKEGSERKKIERARARERSSSILVVDTNIDMQTRGEERKKRETAKRG